MTATDTVAASSGTLNGVNDENCSVAGINKTVIKKPPSQAELEERDRASFYRDLYQFHDVKGTPIVRPPRINGIEVNLHKLYTAVITRGGWTKVNNKNEWDDVLDDIHIPKNCVNACIAIKHIYVRHLDRYEKVHFLGEDVDRIIEDDEENRLKRFSVKNLHAVPLTYNYAQHNVTHQQRLSNRMSTSVQKVSEYDKLWLSLMSPLPNEQDFAINVCILMANESQHTLKIDRCPQLIDALLCHAGVYPHYTHRELFMEYYTNVRENSLQAFWVDCLKENEDILELSYDDYFRIMGVEDKVRERSMKRPPLRPKDCDTEISSDGLNANDEDSKFSNDFLNTRRGLGTHDYIGRRITQIATVMRNLTFLDENLSTLLKNNTFLRFMVMLSNNRWSSLHHMGLDMLGNLAGELVLSDPNSDEVTRCLLTTVTNGILGSDRGVILSCLEVIYKLCKKEQNEIHLYRYLTKEVYVQMCRYITLKDIMLLLYTLECIYSLTSMGERYCNQIMQVRGIIDTLVSLTTVEAQSYGPDGCILMKVIETIPINSSNQSYGQHNYVQHGGNVNFKLQNVQNFENPHGNLDNLHGNQSRSVHHPQTPTRQSIGVKHESSPGNVIVNSPMSSPSPPTSQKQTISENEQFAMAWLKATMETVSGSQIGRIEQLALYKLYSAACVKVGSRVGQVTITQFCHCVRLVFGAQVGPHLVKMILNNSESKSYHFEGIRMKVKPLPVIYKGQVYQGISTSVSAQNQPQMEVKKTIDQSKQVVTVQTTQSNIQQSHITHQQQQQSLTQGSILVTQLSSKTSASNTSLATTMESSTNENVTLISQSSQKSGMPIKNVIVQHPQQQTSSIGTTVISSSQPSTMNPSSSLIKSLLANKVTMTTAGTVESNTTTVCKIASTINIQQVAQRQHLQKQKELAKQLANNPVIAAAQSLQSGIVKSCTKKIITNTGLIVEKKSDSTLEITTNAIQMAANTPPPLAPLSQGPRQSIIHQKIDDDQIFVTNKNIILDRDHITAEMMLTDDSGNKSQVVTANKMLADLLEKKSSEPPLCQISSSDGSLKRKLDGNSDIGDSKRIHKDPSFDDDDIEPVKPSMNAANAFAKLTADLLLDEDMDEDDVVKQSIGSNVGNASAISKIETVAVEPQKQLITVPVQIPVPINRPIIVPQNNPAQMILSPGGGSQQVTQATATIKTESGYQTVPVLLQHTPTAGHHVQFQKQIGIGPGGQQIMQPVPQLIQQAPAQTTYMLATNQQGQTYLVAQPQPQPQQQAVILAQTPQQQGTPQKTIIILQQQPSGAGGPSAGQIIGSVNSGQPQKVIMTAQQGQQMIVTQVPRPVQHQIIVSHPPNSQPTATVIQNIPQPPTQTIITTASSNMSAINHNPGVKTVAITAPATQTVQQHTIHPPLVVPTPAVHQSIPQQPPVIVSKPTSVIQTVEKSMIPHSAVAVQSPVSVQHNEKKQIFVTGSGNIELTELPPTTGAPPPPKIPSPPVTPKIDEEQVDPNWLWVCDWRGCPRTKFRSANEVYLHACTAHCPDNLDQGAEIFCQWGPGPNLCDNLPRKRFSLMTHLQDRHCTPEAFKLAVQRRLSTGQQSCTQNGPVTIIKNSGSQQNDGSGSSSPGVPSNGQNVATASAAMHAIKRYAMDSGISKELADENEGPVTKSIRLTASLILRNLVNFTSTAKRNLKHYESHLANIALSNVESSRTISQVLFEMND